MSTDLALWLMATAIGMVVVAFVALVWLGLRWCVAEWARQSRDVDALFADTWDDRRDGPLPRTTDRRPCHRRFDK